MRCCGAPSLMEMTRLWEGPQLASRAQSLRLVLRSAQLHFAEHARVRVELCCRDLLAPTANSWSCSCCSAQLHMVRGLHASLLS